MAHILQIQNRTRIIETKANQIFREVDSDYKQGKIKSHTEYLYRLYNTIQSFYNSIGKSTMKYRPAYHAPYSNDYNQTMKEAFHDIQTIFSEVDELSNVLNESFKQTEIDRQSLNHRLKKIEDTMNELKLKKTQKANEVIFRDSFIDQSMYDKEMVKGDLASLWTRERILTLQPRAAQSFTTGSTIRILEGNGFPGNTHQVRSLSGQLRFVGEDNLHMNLAEILDNNLDTWFEYELYDVSSEIAKETANLGFEYKEGIKWVSASEETLRLAIQLELPQAQTINWFSISPFIPNDKGVSHAAIKSIKVEDGKGGVSEIIADKETFDEEKVYLFKQQMCKRITILLEQPSPYETVIGHLFFKETNKHNINYLDDMHEEDGKRVNGTLPSIDNVGMKYNPETKLLMHPTATEGSKLENIVNKKTKLFTIPETSQDTRADFEMLPAWRYVIGIREAGISSYEFKEKGTYRSVNFYTVDDIKTISLEADHYIPEEFGEGGWLAYSISIDDGNTWHPISPRGSGKQGKIMYLINSGIPQEGRLDEFGYINTDKDVHQVRLQVEFTRPISKGNEYYTPILKNYQLRIVTQGEEA